MVIEVQFFSYFKDLTGCERAAVTLPEGSTLGVLHEEVMERFPRLSGMRRSTLMAVGVSYESQEHVLREGEEVSFFPPVQGG